MIAIDRAAHVGKWIDFLITATDFPHGDAFRQDQLASGLKARGDLAERTIAKILCDNPQRLYSI